MVGYVESTFQGEPDMDATRAMSSQLPISAHRAPDPSPEEDPVPEPHPIPDKDPVPDHNPSRNPT